MLLINAVVLHPSLKLEYFKLRKWEQSWIDTAVELVTDEYASYTMAGVGADTETMGDTVRGTYIFCCYSNYHTDQPVV